jgi:hypothetical protein
MQVGPIPWTAVDRYAQRHGFDDEEFDYLLQMIKAMDAVYLAHVNKRPEGGQSDGS